MKLFEFFQVQRLRWVVRRRVSEPLVPGDLFIVCNLPENLESKMPLGFPENFFTEIHHLETMPISQLPTQKMENEEVIDLSKIALQFNHLGDLQKLQNFYLGEGISSTGEIYIVVGENWNFEAVNKLSWKLHNIGLKPYFFDANRNLIWQKEWKILKRLTIKGVIIPVNLIALGHWKSKSTNWLKNIFGGGFRNSLQQLAAVYLSEVQTKPPYYIYESDIATWNASVCDGTMKLVF